MTKIFLILFFMIGCSYLHAGKAAESEETTGSTESIKNDDDDEESASIQVVHRDVVTDKEDKTSEKHTDNPPEEVNFTEVPKNINSTETEPKHEFFEDIVRNSGEIQLENRNENIEEVSIPTAVSHEQTNVYNNDHDKIAISFEDITKAYHHDENNKEDSIVEDENNWRSAENLNLPEKKYVDEPANEESVEDEKDYSDEEYIDKKIDLEVKGRMETRQPERRRQFNSRPINFRRYGPLESHGLSDSGHMRNFGEMAVPHYRPVLTRNGIMYTPSLYPMQTGPSLLDRLSGRNNWLTNRVHMNLEAEAFKQGHNRVIGVPQYDDTKMMEDYNDYGPNTNTYSYTPVRKVTTQAPPQQIASPNKFDVFQKLLEASNHPKPQKRMFNEFPGNYHSQHQYPENFGSFNVRRVRRYAWDEPPLRDI